MLAVSAPSRVAGIDAPTLREQGIALDLANWRGVVAPPGLTDSERDQLTARVERMATSAEWKAVLTRNGWDDLLLTGPAFRQFLLAEQQPNRTGAAQPRLAKCGRHRRDAAAPHADDVAVVALGGLALLLVAIVS